MNFPPTLKQLRYLLALQKTMHFGKAAKQCHVSQSTLSAGIQELESLLGVTLVERTKRTVMFTALGQEIARRAQNILSEIDDLTDMAAVARNPLRGIVRMGVIPTIAPFLLPRIMPIIRKKLPDLDLHLREDKSAILCDQLRTGDLDIVLYALPFACGDVYEMPLFDDPFFAAYPKATAPAAQITSDDLNNAQLLLLEEGHCLRDHALSACAILDRTADNTTVSQGLGGTSLHTMIQMVAAGHGVTLLPGMAVEAGLTDGMDIDILPFKDTTPSRTIGLIWRRSNPRTDTFNALAQVIKQVGA